GRGLARTHEAAQNDDARRFRHYLFLPVRAPERLPPPRRFAISATTRSRAATVSAIWSPPSFSIVEVNISHAATASAITASAGITQVSERTYGLSMASSVARS